MVIWWETFKASAVRPDLSRLAHGNSLELLASTASHQITMPDLLCISGNTLPNPVEH